MSGRNLKEFLRNHRADSGSSSSFFDQIGKRSDVLDKSLVAKAVVASERGWKTYGNVDYDSLDADLKSMKAAASRSFGKMRKVAQLTKRRRAEELRKRHYVIWLRESQRLASIEKKFFAFSIDDETRALEEKYARNRIDFREATVKPILELRDDLMTSMKNNKIENGDGTRILEQVELVKIQQESVVTLLNEEEKDVIGEIEMILSEIEEEESSSDCDLSEESGVLLPEDKVVPLEIFHLICSDENLRQAAVHEFEILDSKYALCLEKLREKYSDVIGSLNGGWSREDHWRFCVLLEQYPTAMTSWRRCLYIDRLQKEMPQWSRSQLVEHEQWYLAWCFYVKRRQAYLSSWRRNRRDLLARVKIAFEEAWLENEASHEVAQSREEQKAICARLSQKLAELRRKKIEMMQVEEEMAEKRREAELEELERVEERRRKERDYQKKKLDDYYCERERKRKEDETTNAARLEALRAEMDELTARDKKRIAFRRAEYEKKLAAKREAEIADIDEKKAKEKRLQKLRDQVYVSVDRDLDRAMRPTKASALRDVGASSPPSSPPLQMPLFPMYTYTSETILSDRRVRVEAALRQANILGSDYARSTLARVRPPQPPRKDQTSNLFK